MAAVKIKELIEKLQSFPQEANVARIEGLHVYGDIKYPGTGSGSSEPDDREKLKQALIFISEICKKYNKEPDWCNGCPLLVHCDLDSTCVFSAVNPSSVPNELYYTDYEVPNQEAEP